MHRWGLFLGMMSVSLPVAAVAAQVTISAPATGNTHRAVHFIACASDPDPAVRFAGFTYHWDYGDGSKADITDSAPTHVYQRSGDYIVTVSVTAGSGATSAPASTGIAIVEPTVIPIDAVWLAAHGPAPFALDRDGATYRLETDVTTEAMGIVIAGKNITLDMNGHKLTYDNMPPIHVPNGDFEADPIGSVKVTGWDLTGAPDSAFVVAANDVFLYGGKVLQWKIAKGTSAPQVIKSENIAIPAVNRVYTASITASILGQEFSQCAGRLEVVDAATGKTMDDFNRLDAGPGRGNALVYSFVPPAANPVFLRVTFRPSKSGGPKTFILDRATLTTSMNYGILASSLFSANLCTGSGNHGRGGRVNATVNLPAALQKTYGRVYAPQIIDSKGGGAVTQGQAAGAFSHGIVATDTKGAVAIRGVAVNITGSSTMGIEASYGRPAREAADSRFISGCAVTYAPTGIDVFKREDVPAAIMVRGATPLVVRDCTILNNPQMGIVLGNKADGAVQVVLNNTLHPNTIVTNNYAIQAGCHARIVHNTITTTDAGSSEGIFLQNLSNTETQTDILVSGNHVAVQQRGNREYGTRLIQRAFKMRNYGSAGFTDVLVADNTFIGLARPGGQYMPKAAGGSLYFNGANKNVVFLNNIFKGLILGAADPGDKYNAYGLAVDKSAPGEDVVFRENRIESNDIGILIGTGNSIAKDSDADLLFVNTFFRKSAEGVSRPFTAYLLGTMEHRIVNLAFIGSTYENGASAKIVWGGTGQKDVDFGWLLELTVTDVAGRPVNGATTRVKDADGTELAAGQTDAQGKASLSVRTEHYAGTTAPRPAPIGPGRLTLTVAATGFAEISERVTLTANQQKVIRLESRPSSP